MKKIVIIDSIDDSILEDLKNFYDKYEKEHFKSFDNWILSMAIIEFYAVKATCEKKP